MNRTLSVISLMLITGYSAQAAGVANKAQKPTKQLLDSVVKKAIKDGERLGKMQMNKTDYMEDTLNEQSSKKLKSAVAHRIDARIHGVKIERRVAKFESVFARAFEKALLSRNARVLKSKLSRSAKGKSFSKWPARKDMRTATIDSMQIASVNESDSANRRDFLKSFTQSMKQFDTVEFSEARVLHYSRKHPYAEKHLMRNANMLIAFDARGKQGGERVQMRGKMLVEADLANDAKVRAINLQKLEVLRSSRKPSFVAAKNNLSIDEAKVYPRLEALRRGGYAFSIEDYNNDGLMDAFVGNYGKSTLWQGQKDGSLKQVASPVADITLAKAATFADMNNDGLKDLIITRFSNDDLSGDVVIFKNTAKGFEQVERPFKSAVLRMYAMPMAVADYNNDGLLDFYVGFPGERDFSLNNDRTGPTMANAHGVYINKGNFKFNDITKTMHKLMDEEKRDPSYPHGAVAADYDSDGKVDILIMDDRMNLSLVFKNKGNGKFKSVANDIQIRNNAFGMGVDVGDVNGDGHMDVVMSNASFSTYDRLQSHQTRTHGLRLFLNDGSNNFTDTTVAAGLTDTGEAAGGLTLVDYDNDGLLDIYVVNGLWSGSDRHNKLDSLFAQAQRLKVTNINHMITGQGLRKERETQSPFMKILMHDRTKAGKTLSFAGYQRNRLFKNLGNGKFIEVGYLEGVDSMNDGYMSLAADYNKDGFADLMLRNCDPGAKDKMFPAVEVYRNTRSGNKAIWLTLKGTASNPHGAGARIAAVRTDGVKIVRQIKVNNSAVQAPMQAHIGLAKSKGADIVVKWPSGNVTHHKGIGAGHHVLKESQGLLGSR